ncbi:hypothetical protein Amet_2398 [Alkaliphilus metalliredigens QYMF]|uniref:Uncharacterized protein n=1 Tax=Alkaliphilus metalliredigens (strain QYMF) TaxID=293826 RepID=A6TQT4_ALKMQ|nr:hypothetical protein [Alkaliphilus metalliredigens]ABR48552.1 hypothetical protein Amet_2398 [Alkaliphilus metalliredigens QYMF]
MPKVTKATKKRQGLMRSRWKSNPDITVFERLFAMAEASDFLSGRNGKWTNCNFDWLLNEDNMIKTLEGSYENKESPKSKVNNREALKTKFHLAESRGKGYSNNDLENMLLNKNKQGVVKNNVT